jgi:hypothetical protein
MFITESSELGTIQLIMKKKNFEWGFEPKISAAQPLGHMDVTTNYAHHATTL